MCAGRGGEGWWGGEPKAPTAWVEEKLGRIKRVGQTS